MNVFEPAKAKTVPESDPKIERISFDTQDFGARKSHLPKGAFKNNLSIKHVKAGG